MGKFTEEDARRMAGYETPEPREKPTVIAELDSQKDAADLVKSALRVLAQGATFGAGEEAVAGIKTGSLSSPEYKAERNRLRGGLQEARETLGEYGAPVIEGIGEEITTSLMPLGKLKTIPGAIKRIGSSMLAGAGEAPEMEDVQSYATKSGLLQGGAEAIGAGVGQMFFNEPTSILSKTIGTKPSDIKVAEKADIGRDMLPKYAIRPKKLGGVPVNPPDQERAILGSIERLNKKGFFKQGNKIFDPEKRVFRRTKDSLSGFLKPQTLDDLYSTAEQGITSLKEANEKLLKGRKVDVQKVKRELEAEVANLTYDPYGYNLQAMGDLAETIKDTISRDMKQKGMWKSNTGQISAKDLEITKQSVDSMISSKGFKKRAEDLGVSEESLMNFRKRVDEIVDEVVGNDYKLNNDAIYDLMNVQDVIWEKQGKKYVDTGSQLVDVRGTAERLLDSTINHPSLNILRSDISRLSGSKAGQFGTGITKRFPENYLMQDEQYYPEMEQAPQTMPQEEVPQYDVLPPEFSGVMRNPSSVRSPVMMGFTPKDIVNFRIPRSTQGILENKDKVLAKMVQKGLPDEMVETLTIALNDDGSDLSNIMPLIMTQMPHLFEKSKYKVFDGKFLDPNDRAKAADDISKRDDLSSIERAKMINKINRSGEVPEGL